jgi:MFS family permease
MCGTAPSFPVLLAGRAIKGIGGGGMMVLAQIIFADVVPLRFRPRYFTIVLGSWALGIMLGPILGGVFAEKVTWRWCFYINLPLCAIALVAGALFLKLVPAERRTYRQKVRAVDWTGCLLLTTAATTFLFAITSAGVAYPWNSWRTLLPLVTGICLLVATLFYERRWAAEPFLSHTLFQNASSIINYVAALFQGFLLYATLYYLTFYLAATHLVGPVTAGVNLLPALVFCMVGSPVTSALITRFGTYRWAVWLGYLVATIGFGASITLDEHSSQAVYSTIFAIIGTGLGVILAAVNFATQASVASAMDSGRAAAMYTFMRGIGMCLGVALGGTVFVNAMKVKLAALGLPLTIAENAEGYVEQVSDLPRDDRMRTALLRAYAAGFRGVFIAMTAVSAATLLLTLAIKEFTMEKVSTGRFTVITRPQRSGTAAAPVGNKDDDRTLV